VYITARVPNNVEMTISAWKCSRTIKLLEIVAVFMYKKLGAPTFFLNMARFRLNPALLLSYFDHHSDHCKTGSMLMYIQPKCESYQPEGWPTTMLWQLIDWSVHRSVSRPVFQSLAALLVLTLVHTHSQPGAKGGNAPKNQSFVPTLIW